MLQRLICRQLYYVYRAPTYENNTFCLVKVCSDYYEVRLLQFHSMVCRWYKLMCVREGKELPSDKVFFVN